MQGEVRRGWRKPESNALVHRASFAAAAERWTSATRTLADTIALLGHGRRKTLISAPCAPRRRWHSSSIGRLHQDRCHGWRNGKGVGGERGQLVDDKRETTSASASTTPHRHLSQTICLSEAAQPCAPVSPGELVPLGVRLTALSLAEAVGGCIGWGCSDTGVTVVEGGEFDAAGGAGDTPRSFCAMFGTSRAVGVQYCKS